MLFNTLQIYFQSPPPPCGHADAPRSSLRYFRIMFNSSTGHVSPDSLELQALAEDFLLARLPAWREAHIIWGELCCMGMLPILAEGHQRMEPDPEGLVSSNFE